MTLSLHLHKFWLMTKSRRIKTAQSINYVSQNRTGLRLLPFFIERGHSRSLFLYFHLVKKVNNKLLPFYEIADDWIRTQVLWGRKQRHCELQHNPSIFNIFFERVLFFTPVRAPSPFLRANGIMKNNLLHICFK